MRAVARRLVAGLGGVLALTGALNAAGPIDPYDAGPPPDAGRPLGDIFAEAARAAARDRNALGLRLLREGETPDAHEAFREAYALDPTDPEIADNLGFTSFKLGNRVDAERYFEEALRLSPRRATALHNLADLLSESDDPRRLERAAALLARLRMRRDNDPAIIVRQARVAARRHLFAAARDFYTERLAQGPIDDALAIELGDFERDRGELQTALEWYRRVKPPSPAAAEARRRVRELEAERLARRYGLTRSGGAPSDAVRAQRESARAALEADQPEEALRLLAEVIRQAPGYPDAYADLGDARMALDDPPAAEVAYLRALVLDGSQARAARALGDLYHTRSQSADAALMWERALDARPEWSHLHLRIARAWQSAGDLPRALRRVRLGLAALPEDAPDDRLRQLELELTRALPAPPPDTRTEDDAGVGAALARARAQLQLGDPGAALAALASVPEADRGAEVLGLEGYIFLKLGRTDDGIAAFESALRDEPDQPRLHTVLGRTLLDAGRVEAARRHLQTAADRGESAAVLPLLRIDATAREPVWLHDLLALPTLWRLRARAHGARVDQPELQAGLDRLRAQLDARVERAVAIGGAGLAGLTLLGLVAARRRWGGDTVAELVDRHPEAGPDVQRVLSAIRHEVLKHNTLALGGLDEALVRGEDAVQKAAWVRQSLLGPADDPAADAAVHRLRAYAEQLRQIGRSHGRRLNLERRDPALSALLRGFRQLESAAGELDRTVIRGRASGSLKRSVSRAARSLNVEGLGALRSLLDQLKVFDVTPAALRAIFDRTRREPGFAEVPVAPLALDAARLPARVELPRVAFEDILTNLFRNAIQAAAAHESAGGEVVIGLAVDEDDDPITGLSSLRFRVRDRAPQTLTTDMLRGRFIEDGLGLTGDLVSRFEGSLDVEPDESPWTKAVVLTLPRADETADTAQRAAITGSDHQTGPLPEADDAEEGRWTL